jgi:hypothetical protein
MDIDGARRDITERTLDVSESLDRFGHARILADVRVPNALPLSSCLDEQVSEVTQQLHETIGRPFALGGRYEHGRRRTYCSRHRSTLARWTRPRRRDPGRRAVELCAGRTGDTEAQSGKLREKSRGGAAGAWLAATIRLKDVIVAFVSGLMHSSVSPPWCDENVQTDMSGVQIL